jgi:citrate synthase
MPRMLTTDEAARRLGVKSTTLYAYVSRGMLHSHRAPGGRHSLFDEADVEALARRSRTERQRGLWTDPVTTAITALREDGPSYRGVPLHRLLSPSATEDWVTFEEVAQWLWRPERASLPPERSGSELSRVSADEASRAIPPTPSPAWKPAPWRRPPELPPEDLLSWSVVMTGAADPRRGDLSVEAVEAAASRLIATMVDVLAVLDHRRADGGSTGARGVTRRAPTRGDTIAARLSLRLVPSQPSDQLVRAVNAALVALTDHELATSTMSVRLAASTRASLYDAVLAGLGVLRGRLHGGVAPVAHALLVDAERRGVRRAVDHVLRWQGRAPGFGHSLDVYAEGDPRFTILWPFFQEVASAEQVEMVRSLVRLADDMGLPPPNVDLAVAAITWAAGMPGDAGPALFTVARVAGWTAHFLEELGERPLRFRVRAVYAARGRL